MGAAELKYANGFVDRLFGEGLHAKRVESLTNATVGVMTGASLAVSTIGHGLALAQGGISKHAIKQVDRLLSNPGIDVKELFMLWVPPIIGSRKSIEIAMDWTDFDADNQTTIMLSLLTSHGRATPLIWLTVGKDTLKDNRNRYEYQVLVWLSEALPADVKVLIVADRGFGDDNARALLKKYSKRWSIECSFRDTKDPHFGMGMAQIRINSPERRDRLWLLNALAVALLTLLGAAGEALGFDKHLKASTTKRRVHSLFRQGCLHYQLMPTMPETRLRPLMEKFVELMREQPLLVNIYGLV